jgi:hypothetical protein
MMTTKRLALGVTALALFTILIFKINTDNKVFDVEFFHPSKDGYGWVVTKSIQGKHNLRLRLVGKSGESLALAAVDVDDGLHKIIVLIQGNKGKINSLECTDLFVVISAYHIPTGSCVFHTSVCPRFNSTESSFIVVTDRTRKNPVELLTTSGINTVGSWESLVLDISPVK